MQGLQKQAACINLKKLKEREYMKYPLVQFMQASLSPGTSGLASREKRLSYLNHVLGLPIRAAKNYLKRCRLMGRCAFQKKFQGTVHSAIRWLFVRRWNNCRMPYRPSEPPTCVLYTRNLNDWQIILATL